jgi:hypothetical protein
MQWNVITCLELHRQLGTFLFLLILWRFRDLGDVNRIADFVSVCSWETGYTISLYVGPRKRKEALADNPHPFRTRILFGMSAVLPTPTNPNIGLYVLDELKIFLANKLKPNKVLAWGTGGTNPVRGADAQLGDDGDVDRAMGNAMPCERRIRNDVEALSGRKWRHIHCCASAPPFALVFTPVPPPYGEDK